MAWENYGVPYTIDQRAAIGADGTIVAWGSDIAGTGVLAAPAGTFKAVSAGAWLYDAAIRTDGSIVVWGQDSWGGPPPRPPGGRFRDVRVSSYLAFALAEECYANCDGSTAEPVLNVLDFACFFNQFAAGSPAANCDNSTAAPELNVLDFVCFLNRFATGCT